MVIQHAGGAYRTKPDSRRSLRPYRLPEGSQKPRGGEEDSHTARPEPLRSLRRLQGLVGRGVGNEGERRGGWSDPPIGQSAMVSRPLVGLCIANKPRATNGTPKDITSQVRTYPITATAKPGGPAAPSCRQVLGPALSDAVRPTIGRPVFRGNGRHSDDIPFLTPNKRNSLLSQAVLRAIIHGDAAINRPDKGGRPILLPWPDRTAIHGSGVRIRLAGANRLTGIVSRPCRTSNGVPCG